MEGEGPGRGLECDCGYVAHGEDDDELVAAVQAHARDVHGMKLPAELILTLTVTNGAPFHRGRSRPGEPGPRGPAPSPRLTR
jgi:hypothetical protein